MVLPSIITSQPEAIVRYGLAAKGYRYIDLDDGSSNYVIRNNLSLRGGIKVREVRMMGDAGPRPPSLRSC